MHVSQGIAGNCCGSVPDRLELNNSICFTHAYMYYVIRNYVYKVIDFYQGESRCQKDGCWWLEACCWANCTHAQTCMMWTCLNCIFLWSRIRRYCVNLKKSSEEVQKMYNGDASQRAFALYISCMTHDLACCNFSILNFVTMTFFHACMHAHVCFTCMRSIIYIYTRYFFRELQGLSWRKCSKKLEATGLWWKYRRKNGYQTRKRLKKSPAVWQNECWKKSTSGMSLELNTACMQYV